MGISLTGGNREKVNFRDNELLGPIILHRNMSFKPKDYAYAGPLG